MIHDVLFVVGLLLLSIGVALEFGINAMLMCGGAILLAVSVSGVLRARQ